MLHELQEFGGGAEFFLLCGGTGQGIIKEIW